MNKVKKYLNHNSSIYRIEIIYSFLKMYIYQQLVIICEFVDETSHIYVFLYILDFIIVLCALGCTVRT